MRRTQNNLTSFIDDGDDDSEEMNGMYTKQSVALLTCIYVEGGLQSPRGQK